MDFQINSFVGAGVVKFGMSQSEVQGLMGSNNVEPFKRNPSSDLLCDYYCDIGVFIYYNKFKFVSAMEFHEPANPIYQNVAIFKVTASEIYNLISSLDQNVDIDEDGLTSISLGIGIYAPNYEEDPCAPVEGTIVFEKGYYD